MVEGDGGEAYKLWEGKSMKEFLNGMSALIVGFALKFTTQGESIKEAQEVSNYTEVVIRDIKATDSSLIHTELSLYNEEFPITNKGSFIEVVWP